jgi:hypothetical protein
MHHSTPRLRQRLTHVALAAVLGTVAIGLAQCRMVNDTVTGVDLKNSATLCARNDCIHKCYLKFKMALRVEEMRHRAALKECRHDYACKKREEATHRSIVRRLEMERRACKRGCYYQEGSGVAGN